MKLPLSSIPAPPPNQPYANGLAYPSIDCQRPHHTLPSVRVRFFQETVFLALASCAFLAGWYDYLATTNGGNTVTDSVRLTITLNPSWNAVGGGLCTLLIVGLARIWRMHIRYAFVIFVIGAVAGHLFLSVYR